MTPEHLTDDQRAERAAHHAAGDFDEYTIEKVDLGDEYIGITTTDHTGFGYRFHPSWPTPKAGDRIRLFTVNFSTICGLDLNGRPLYFKTQAERDAEHEEWKANHDRELHARFEQDRERLDADFLTLPPELQVRIQTLRDADPDWRWKHESYEMFVCTQAVAFHDALQTEDAIREWHELGYADQRERVPAMADGHSGNTFGCAVQLALMLAGNRREALIASPQALSPIVGDPRFESERS